MGVSLLLIAGGGFPVKEGDLTSSGKWGTGRQEIHPESPEANVTETYDVDEIHQTLKMVLESLFCKGLTGLDREAMKLSIARFVAVESAGLSPLRLVEKFKTPRVAADGFVKWLKTEGALDTSEGRTLH